MTPEDAIAYLRAMESVTPPGTTLGSILLPPYDHTILPVLIADPAKAEFVTHFMAMTPGALAAFLTEVEDATIPE